MEHMLGSLKVTLGVTWWSLGLKILRIWWTAGDPAGLVVTSASSHSEGRFLGGNELSKSSFD